jgi:hypothetical protein
MFLPAVPRSQSSGSKTTVMSMVASNTRRAVPRSGGLTGSFLIQLFDPLFVIGESVRYAANDAMSVSETTLERLKLANPGKRLEECFSAFRLGEISLS